MWSRCLAGTGLFFIHLRAVWWLMPNTLAKPRDEERSWEALTTVSLNSSLLRTVWKTPPKPHALHLYLGFPEPFEPFLTICSEPHLWQHLCSITMTKKFAAKILKITHMITLPKIFGNQPCVIYLHHLNCSFRHSPLLNRSRHSPLLNCSSLHPPSIPDRFQSFHRHLLQQLFLGFCH